ncbi:hypothetical protein [Streptomyces sp. VNUA24]|uniref:hypothetical protein n=1 Tax=Streptomyces sp. VNUA24 TaxID=3031131 RepID=UPI0023B795F4|nr:hypothetical protein [Streptomyces sp. VNUA24]WEH15024.1 hypothetical protein PYR72_15340 [Streptomyces sp. VNUA24]
MRLLHIEVWIGNGWQRVTRLDGKSQYLPPEDGSWDDDLRTELDAFLKADPGVFWVETTGSPEGVLFGPGVPRLFRLAPAH